MTTRSPMRTALLLAAMVLNGPRAVLGSKKRATVKIERNRAIPAMVQNVHLKLFIALKTRTPLLDGGVGPMVKTPVQEGAGVREGA